MTPNDITALAQRLAEEEIGGPPPRCTGHKADRYNAAYNAVVKALAALSPQRLDAAAVEQAAISLIVDLCGAGASQSSTNLRVVEDHLRQFARARATPSQRLDAATVERCAQVAEANAATSVPLMNGLGVAACIEQGRHRAGTEIAKQIRALATEPHQHGGKGA